MVAVQKLEMNVIILNQLFTGILEIHCNPVADDGLNLTDTPVGTVRVTNERTRK